MPIIVIIILYQQGFSNSRICPWPTPRPTICFKFSRNNLVALVLLAFSLLSPTYILPLSLAFLNRQSNLTVCPGLTGDGPRWLPVNPSIQLYAPREVRAIWSQFPRRAAQTQCPEHPPVGVGDKEERGTGWANWNVIISFSNTSVSENDYVLR